MQVVEGEGSVSLHGLFEDLKEQMPRLARNHYPSEKALIHPTNSLALVIRQSTALDTLH